MFKFWKRKQDPAATPAITPAVPLDEPAIREDATTAPAAVDVARVDAAQVDVARDIYGLPITAPAIDSATARASVAEKPVAAAPVATWRDRLRGNSLGRAMAALFSGNPRLDDTLLDEIETALLTADVGVAATTFLIDDLRRRMQAREFADASALLAQLRLQLLRMLEPIAQPLVIDETRRPFVLMVVGVNGVGKTTTIGKLAQHLQREGARVMLAAGDTFRAAAVEQLRTWGERNGVTVVSQGSGADSASVIFDALKSAQSRDIDVLIADTAGRLHTQTGLMDELGKIRRVLAKLDVDAPHEVLQVIDGTTGQNALSQLRQFNLAVGVTGLAVTKLDGSAKGGVLFALAREFGIPIRYVGIGESLDDLRVFDPEAFVDGLLPAQIGAA
jgi:fused signal recognition particle receptor